MAKPRQRIEVVSKQVLAAGAVSTEHFGIFPDYEHPVIYPKEGCLTEASEPATTFTQWLAKAAANFPDRVALAVERNPPAPEAPGVAPSMPWESWKKWTWAEYNRDARSLAKTFMSWGVEQFGAVSIFGFNAPEWFIAAFGAMLCSGRYVGIYMTDTPDQVQYKVSHSGSTVMVVDGMVEFESVASKIDEMPGLKAVVLWGIPAPVKEVTRKDGTACKVFTFDEAVKLGEALPDQELEARLAAQKPGHAIGMIYTSGTTGNPKAVMVSHDSINASCALTAVDEMNMAPAFAGDGARLLSYLPLSHIAAGMVDMLVPARYAGQYKKTGCVYFARPYDMKEMTLAARIAFVKPTIFFAVPRVFEKMQARMMAVAATITGVKKSLSTWAKNKGLEYARNQLVGGSGAKPFLHGVADKLVLSKAREALGLDQCKVFITGAAPISRELLEYFGQLGMILQVVYGMSESCGLTTITTMKLLDFGSVGHSLTPGLEVAVFKEGPNGENVPVPPISPNTTVVPEENQGEICFRGRTIMMGYMANRDFGEEHCNEIRKKNASTVDKDGWLHSGDKGCCDTNGSFRITGRYKELIIGAGGENIAPVPVEENLKKLCPAVANVMMVGDNRRYNVALVTLQAEGATGQAPGGDDLTPTAVAVNPSVTKVSQAMTDPTWLAYIQKGIDETNNNPTVCQNNAWKIQKFKIVPRDFSIETGELTATLKLRRSVAEEMWAELIDSMY